MIPDMIHTPYIAPRISVMAPPPVTAERFVDELLSGLCMPDGGEKTYAPYTRDTFGIAVKATYAEDADGKPIMIFKNPKTDSGHFKKSQRGCCKVVYDYTYHNFFCQDGLTWEESQVGNWLQPVFKDGKLLRIYTLDEVRKNLHEGNF